MDWVKSATLFDPCSVSRPSPIMARNRSQTPAQAFSTSSKRISLRGLLRTGRVIAPPDSQPTYPRGRPMSRDLASAPARSGPSKRSIAFSSLNR